MSFSRIEAPGLTVSSQCICKEFDLRAHMDADVLTLRFCDVDRKVSTSAKTIRIYFRHRVWSHHQQR